MAMYPTKVPHFVDGRKQPLFYELHAKGFKSLRVLGHYEAECGGCDTISKNVSDPSEKAMHYIFRLVREAHADGFNVLFEGVILTTILGELPALIREELPLTVVNLTTDLEGCLLGISDRRLRKDQARHEGALALSVEDVRATLEPVTVKNNVGKLKSAAKTAAQLRSLGANVYDCNREQAVDIVANVLGINR